MRDILQQDTLRVHFRRRIEVQLSEEDEQGHEMYQIEQHSGTAISKITGLSVLSTGQRKEYP